jgi:catechol 2,3-dioxygenase-like lactoylglutathione lyase family enzyme
LFKDTPSPEGLHFGFREYSRTAVDEWGRKAAEDGVAIDFGPGQRDCGGYEVTVLDPDGYAIQIWTDSRE